MMGIPTEYNDAKYIGRVPLTPKVSMLPLTKEQLASKECVGDYACNGSVTLSRPRVCVVESITPVDGLMVDHRTQEGHLGY